MRNPLKRRRSRARLNRVRKAWSDLDTNQQAHLSLCIEAAADRPQSPSQVSVKRTAPPTLAAVLRSTTDRCQFVKAVPTSIIRTASRVQRAIFGDEQRGWIHFAGSILDAVVIGFGEDPRSRSGQSLRQLVAACWLMMCVLMLNNFAQIDLLNGMSKGWALVYGSLGALYLGLWCVLVIGIVQDRRKWATQR